MSRLNRNRLEDCKTPGWDPVCDGIGLVHGPQSLSDPTSLRLSSRRLYQRIVKKRLSEGRPDTLLALVWSFSTSGLVSSDTVLSMNTSWILWEGWTVCRGSSLCSTPCCGARSESCSSLRCITFSSKVREDFTWCRTVQWSSESLELLRLFTKRLVLFFEDVTSFSLISQLLWLRPRSGVLQTRLPARRSWTGTLSWVRTAWSCTASSWSFMASWSSQLFSCFTLSVKTWFSSDMEEFTQLKVLQPSSEALRSSRVTFSSWPHLWRPSSFSCEACWLSCSVSLVSETFLSDALVWCCRMEFLFLTSAQSLSIICSFTRTFCSSVSFECLVLLFYGLVPCEQSFLELFNFLH